MAFAQALTRSIAFALFVLTLFTLALGCFPGQGLIYYSIGGGHWSARYPIPEIPKHRVVSNSDGVYSLEYTEPFGLSASAMSICLTFRKGQ